MERNKLARQIIDTCLEMTRLGLNQGTAGNVSVRYQDGMLITPTGIPYEKLTTKESVVSAMISKIPFKKAIQLITHHHFFCLYII